MGYPPKSSRAWKTCRNCKTRQAAIQGCEYCKALEKEDLAKIKVHNIAKGKLKGMYHFRNVFILNKTRQTFDRRLLVIR